MSVSQQLVDIEEFGMKTIACPRQPGRLRISMHACALRYRMAQKKNAKHPHDEFDMARAAGLEICRTCPEGRFYSKRLKKTQFVKRFGTKSPRRRRERGSKISNN